MMFSFFGTLYNLVTVL